MSPRLAPARAGGEERGRSSLLTGLCFPNPPPCSTLQDDQSSSLPEDFRDRLLQFRKRAPASAVIAPGLSLSAPLLHRGRPLHAEPPSQKKGGDPSRKLDALARASLKSLSDAPRQHAQRSPYLLLFFCLHCSLSLSLQAPLYVIAEDGPRFLRRPRI